VVAVAAVAVAVLRHAMAVPVAIRVAAAIISRGGATLAAAQRPPQKTTRQHRSRGLQRAPMPQAQPPGRLDRVAADAAAEVAAAPVAVPPMPVVHRPATRPARAAASRRRLTTPPAAGARRARWRHQPPAATIRSKNFCA
jgi:hypothetical protein